MSGSSSASGFSEIKYSQNTVITKGNQFLGHFPDLRSHQLPLEGICGSIAAVCLAAKLENKLNLFAALVNVLGDLGLEDLKSEEKLQEYFQALGFNFPSAIDQLKSFLLEFTKKRELVKFISTHEKLFKFTLPFVLYGATLRENREVLVGYLSVIFSLFPEDFAVFIAAGRHVQCFVKGKEEIFLYDSNRYQIVRESRLQLTGALRFNLNSRTLGIAARLIATGFTNSLFTPSTVPATAGAYPFSFLVYQSKSSITCYQLLEACFKNSFLNPNAAVVKDLDDGCVMPCLLTALEDGLTSRNLESFLYLLKTQSASPLYKTAYHESVLMRILRKDFSEGLVQEAFIHCLFESLDKEKEILLEQLKSVYPDQSLTDIFIKVIYSRISKIPAHTLLSSEKMGLLFEAFNPSFETYGSLFIPWQQAWVESLGGEEGFIDQVIQKDFFPNPTWILPGSGRNLLAQTLERISVLGGGNFIIVKAIRSWMDPLFDGEMESLLMTVALRLSPEFLFSVIFSSELQVSQFESLFNFLLKYSRTIELFKKFFLEDEYPMTFSSGNHFQFVSGFLKKLDPLDARALAQACLNFYESLAPEKRNSLMQIIFYKFADPSREASSSVVFLQEPRSSSCSLDWGLKQRVMM